MIALSFTRKHFRRLKKKSKQNSFFPSTNKNAKNTNIETSIKIYVASKNTFLLTKAFSICKKNCSTLKYIFFADASNIIMPNAKGLNWNSDHIIIPSVISSNCDSDKIFEKKYPLSLSSVMNNLAKIGSFFRISCLLLTKCAETFLFY